MGVLLLNPYPLTPYSDPLGHYNTEFQSVDECLINRFNPYLTNGFAHHYHLDESTFVFRGVGCDFYFLFHFSMKTF